MDLTLRADSRIYNSTRPIDAPQLGEVSGYNNISPPPYSSWPEATPSSTSSEDDFFSQALDFTRRTAPPPTFTPRLSRPVAIPQTTAGLGQSFLRAWAPILQSYGIAQQDLLNFIDNLNVVSTANPPLQALNLAGSILGMVPSHVAQATAFGLQAVAKVGTVAVSKGRTEIYMKEVNEKVFKPRRLKATIASTQAVRAVLAMPHNVPFLVPLTNQVLGMSPMERILISVQPYSAPLDLHVPPPAAQTTMLAKISAKQVEMQAKRCQKKAMKNREKALEKESKDDEKEDKNLRKRQKKEEKRERSRERKEEKKQRKADRKKRDKDEESGSSDSDMEDRRQFDGHVQSRSGERENAEMRDTKRKEKEGKRDKELKTAEKLLWVLIENL